MIEFEWDGAKAAENFRKHGVSFELAAKAFRDPFGMEWIDDREDYGEVRTLLLGMADGSVLTVVYTERGSRIRLTSARRATRYEQDRYHLENGS
ncbi:BrnT family toxin [Phenylobacterium sp.]|uniref:BrnT family toxin n=1 Tax=Phenylobacterium sp. TaxID=1871053 RepID=UPI0025CFEB52|nr:BrnT family toxin [Phenylobacterium sp.]MCA3746556.1 BrnT family toxin [Phenylobacterium sp.]